MRQIVAETGVADEAVFISFDHTVPQSLKERLPGIRTEGITHARHADIVAVARAADLDSVSIEHMMFRPEDGARAASKPASSVRLHLAAARGVRPLRRSRPRPPRPELRAWLADGVVDTISGDDVAFLAELAAIETEARKSA